MRIEDAANDKGVSVLADWAMEIRAQGDGKTTRILDAAGTTVMTFDPKEHPGSAQPDCDFTFRIRFTASKFPPSTAFPDLLASALSQATAAMTERDGSL